MNSVYPKEMVWRAKLAALWTGGSQLDCLHDIYCYHYADGLSINMAYNKACYRNSSAGIKGRHCDKMDLVVNHTDCGNAVFQDSYNEEAIDSWLDIKAMDLTTKEHLILYLLAHKETGTQIGKQLGVSTNTAIRHIKKLREKIERAIK